MRVNSAVVLTALVVCASSCRSHPVETSNEDPWEQPRRPAHASVDASVNEPATAAPGELVPGTIRAFGVLMPVGTTEALATETERMFYVQAPMSAVMRYLQARIDIVNGEIHPLGAMIRNAHVRTNGPDENYVVDLGVRDENGRTLVTLWNRSQQALPPRSTDEGFRAAGFDPATRRPVGQNNF
jgi:hypothetical protein